MSDAAVSQFDEFFTDGARFESAVPQSGQQKKAKDKKITALKIIVAVLGFFLLVEGLVYSLVIPCFSQPSVVYEGLSLASREAVSAKLAPLAGAPWSRFDTEKAVALLSSVSCIESVSVDKQFPDKVFVSVKERLPVAKTILSVNGRSKPVQIDENCVLFGMQADAAEQDNSIPLISGIPVDALQEGMRLPAKYRVLMEQIAAIRKLPQKYFAAISEIQVVPKEYGNYELALYPTQAKVRVLTDRSLTEDALKYMMVVLDVVNSIEPDVVEVDLRYDSLSYRCR